MSQINNPTANAVTTSRTISTTTPLTGGGDLSADRTLALIAMTDGQLIIGSTGLNSVIAALTGTANRITVTNGAGSITLTTPQDTHSGASPTFTNLTLSGLTANAFIFSGTAGLITSTLAPTNGQLLIGSTGAAPVLGTIAGTTNQISVALGAGTITLSIPQNIHSGATPTFSSLTLSGLTANAFIFSGTAGLLTSTLAPTNGQLLIGSTGAAPVLGTITGTTNQISIAVGAGTITLSTPQNIHTAASPTFAGLTLTSPLTVPNGGTGVATLTDGGILLGGGTGAIKALGVAANGQIPIGDGTTDPVLATITAGANITVTNAAGSVTIAVTGLAASTNIQVFTANGTWTKPANAQSVEVILIGGGGGGGSGAVTSSTSQLSGGGGGGGGGGIMRWTFNASVLGATETVTVGAAGTGGAAAGTGNANGNNGVAGGNTTFGSWLAATGGGLGAGGANQGEGGAGGAAGNGMFAGSAGATGAGTSAASAATAVNLTSAAGGGGGGGINTSNVITAASAGGNSRNLVAANAITGGAAGTAGGAGGAGGAATTNSPQGGAGGGGGAAVTSGNAGAGGNSGLYGGGGGGGGATRPTASSGAGGAGSAGIVIVITHF